MKIGIFGANGYIGSEFVRQLKEISGVHIIPLASRLRGNRYYTYPELGLLIKSLGSIDVIINAAAYIGGKSVAECEQHKDDTINANVIFPKMLGEFCNDKGVVLGHLSSGCLFNGYTDGGYKEDDQIHLGFRTKCSFYTGTKVMAEDALFHVEKKYIWRIRLPFDNINNSRNYLSKIMSFDKLIAAENSLSNRQESVSACIKCIMHGVPFGTYHVANQGGIRTEEIVTLLRRILGDKKNYQYFASVEELDRLTNIPRSNTVLNIEKLLDTGIYMPHVYDSVEQALKTWVA